MHAYKFIAVKVEEVPSKDLGKISVFIASDRFKHSQGSSTHSCGGHNAVKALLCKAQIGFYSLVATAMSIEKYNNLEEKNMLHLNKPFLENYDLVCSPQQMVTMFPSELGPAVSVSAVTPSVKKVSKPLLDVTNLNKESFKPSSSPLVQSASTESAASTEEASAAATSQKRTASSSFAFPASSTAAQVVTKAMDVSRDKAKKAKVEHGPITAYEAWKRRNPNNGVWKELSRDSATLQHWQTIANRDTREEAKQRNMFASFKMK